MKHVTQPKMAELRKLVRRLDGLKGGMAVANAPHPHEARQRKYVGTLRGAADLSGGRTGTEPQRANRQPAIPPVLWAVAAGALVLSVAALSLGRSYDPARSNLPNFADSHANPALAKAWYERAVAPGTHEAAAYIQPQSTR